MSPSKVLVLARDPMVAALLGLYAELASYVPAFADEGEQPDEALARVKPLFVVLLDDSLEAARSDLFFAQAAKRRIGLAVFGRAAAGESPGLDRTPRGVIRFALPIDFDRFRMLLETGGHDAWWRRGSDRRQAPAGSPQLERWPDGALVYVDRAGQRWQVYDRRGGERRQAGERLFVNEAGETWACPLPGAEPGEPSVLDLERQLERAQRV